MTSIDDLVVWSGSAPPPNSSIFELLQRIIFPSEGSVTTLQRDATTNAWLRVLIYDIVTRSARERSVPTDSVVRCVIWLAELPIGMPKPFFAIGDDGSLGLEWERGGNYLYVVFGRSFDQVYFEGSNGDEWESDLESATDKLSHAMRMVAAS